MQPCYNPFITIVMYVMALETVWITDKNLSQNRVTKSPPREKSFFFSDTLLDKNNMVFVKENRYLFFQMRFLSIFHEKNMLQLLLGLGNHLTLSQVLPPPKMFLTLVYFSRQPEFRSKKIWKGDRRRFIVYCPHLWKTPQQSIQPAQQSP